ncbi:MAG: methionine--tRNA ligase [Methylobacterium sp.]|nr:methionine--tRNA ligase [Methylobacterium sp.]MCA3603856.1 methionine--tRNA ligase [Methylobacterium sp.]MCA3614085.1 methionine--tRNA ligase [Methylobacterium sp.]MCA4910557.1 methionine--tRNA ligase [Methylobacterium sp.]
MAQERFFLTTAISYPNGKPHLGHAYELIASDAIARFHRLDGKDVFFLTGTDEHGLKMVQTAEREGLPVRDLANRNAQAFRDMGKALGASNDDFIRTTEERHYEASQALWKKMEAAGDIYLSKHSGWYSVRDEAYFDESELTTGEGGQKFAPSGAPVEWSEVDSYFFRLSKYQDKLLALYQAQPNFIGPDTRRNEVVSFVTSGLKDLSISRDTFTWGVPVPGNPKHVMYVWVDALTNYITACGYPDEGDPRWKYWPASVHIIGKDIVRFHAVIWPAMLMSAGLPIPQRVFGHGFLTNRGEKMSKSLGNVLDPLVMAEQYGVDQIRYFFLREVPFGQDGSYSHEAIVARINADLANDLGNLAQRSLSMVAKNCEAKVPLKGPLFPEDQAILAQAYGLIAESRAAMADFQIHAMLNAIWRVVAETNRYFAAQAPWALKKTDPARMETVLWTTAEILRVIGLLVQPIMPESGGKLLDLLAVPAEARGFAAAGSAHRLVPGTPLPEPKGLFPRYIEPEAGQGA